MNLNTFIFRGFTKNKKLNSGDIIEIIRYKIRDGMEKKWITGIFIFSITLC